MWDPEAIIIPLASFWLIFMVIKTSLEYKTRKVLIEKGMINENVKFLAKIQNGFMSSLKWGLVLLGIGLGALIYRVIPTDRYSEYHHEEVMFGLMILLAGAGLVIHYLIAARASKHNEDAGGVSSR
jgi:hypothetical protein